ncbi:hypothetical protein [Streptomyces sp. RPT161]|uniref:hypothetical protein n=1 Tax=Streptomyces sp. RPT161 TaxID=3015993 RepID=UPI0022B8A693|nr:hypothetical protein [Streptomyces sp. RPT161]
MDNNGTPEPDSGPVPRDLPPPQDAPDDEDTPASDVQESGTYPDTDEAGSGPTDGDGDGTTGDEAAPQEPPD